ncbi:MAG: hypothetical protein OEX19_05895 [Gammaproteobacteria bacterium]|nr:hypothetical protein [Gammaproteobacteria bacterium]
MKLKTVLILTMLGLSSVVEAGIYRSATIDEITIDNSGVARVTTSDGIQISETSCSTTGDNTTSQFTFTTTTNVGKAWQTLIVTALVSGKKVNLNGTATCLNWETTTPYESLSNLYLFK